MRETIRERDGGTVGNVADQDELMQIPEVREQIAKTLFDHWENWVDEKIPALGNQTPRQAVKDSDGRESVEALLLDAQQHMEDSPQMRDAGASAIAEVRRRLGLDRPAPVKSSKAGSGKNADRIDEVKRLVESFGDSRLGREYTGMALRLCDKIGRMHKLSIQRGRIEIWSAAIIYVIARLNFLFDPENEFYITADDMCTFFGTKKSTVSAKASLIQKTTKIFLGDPDFSSDAIVDMFRFYETEDGLLIPASILDNPDNQRVVDETQPKPLLHPASHKTPRRSKTRAESPPHDPGKKDADDRQLNLFDDKC